jgi:integrase
MVWATAMYAGLRRGELGALRVSDVDLDTGVIRVGRSVDDKQIVGETKSRTKRTVPIPSLLRQYLREHLIRTGHRDDDLLFTSASGGQFTPTQVSRSADKARKLAKLERITLHECRHTYASLMIAAGVNAKALSTFMGHSSITITYDRYGHLMPGAEAEAGGLLDSYLTRATG